MPEEERWVNIWKDLDKVVKIQKDIDVRFIDILKTKDTSEAERKVLSLMSIMVDSHEL